MNLIKQKKTVNIILCLDKKKDELLKNPDFLKDVFKDTGINDEDLKDAYNQLNKNNQGNSNLNNQNNNQKDSNAKKDNSDKKQ